MWRFTCLPRTVYDFLYPFKPLFRCSQARHFVIFCWLLVAIIRDPGAGTLKGLCPYLPPHLSYWALIRMLRSGKWDAQAVHERDVQTGVTILTATRRWQALPHWRHHPQTQAGPQASLRAGDTPK